MADKGIFERQKVRIRFKDPDMDFMFGWMLGAGVITGLSPGELFALAGQIKERNPKSWREAFASHAKFLTIRGEKDPRSGGLDHMAATFAYRAAIQYCDPTSKPYADLLANMEQSFSKATAAMGLPIAPIAVPFEGRALTGYWLRQDRPRGTLIVIGGGDTYREDLYYFGGEPALLRGYDAVMVDLPGQGQLPGHGLTFCPDMAAPISAIVDWLTIQAPDRAEKLAIYGLSGGGFFTAQAVARDPRLKAWIASTPIFDIGRIFENEMGALLRTPPWLLAIGTLVSGLFDESRRLTYRKYAWQWGVKSMAEAVRGSVEQAPRVDLDAIHCPTLSLMGEAEGPELRRQAQEVHAALTARGVDSTLRAFTPEEGADAHCQVGNFKLAHRVVFDWLDERFAAA